MNRMWRSMLVFGGAAILMLFIFHIFSQKIPIIYPDISSEELAKIETALLQTDTRNLDSLIKILNVIPLDEVFTYEFCLENNNQVLLPVFDSYVNIDDFKVQKVRDLFVESGAMGFRILVDNKYLPQLYAQRNQEDCKATRIGYKTPIKIEGGEFKKPLLLDAVGIDVVNANAIIFDTSKSKLYGYLPDSNFPIIYLMSLIAWSGFVLLCLGIYKFIRDGI